MPVPPAAVDLVGRVVRLDPTVLDDDVALFAALDDERVYASGYGGGPAGRPADPAGMRATTAAAERDRPGPGHPSYRVAYTVRLVAGGEARRGRHRGRDELWDISVPDEKAHIGWTGYGPRWWSTAVNPECKSCCSATRSTTAGWAG